MKRKDRREPLSRGAHSQYGEPLDPRGVPNEAIHALTPEQERDVLDFDPWGERDATYRTLRSGFAKCRQSHECAICFGPIAAGERVWAKTETDDGKVKTFRFCAECCWCIALRFEETQEEDGYDSGWLRLEERWEIGRTRAEEQQAVAKDSDGSLLEGKPDVPVVETINERSEVPPRAR